MTINTNNNDNKDNNKINISINLAPEIKKKKKYKKRKARLSAEDKNKILGGSGANFATQTPANYLPKYSDRSLGSGNFFSPQPDNNQRLPIALPYQLPQALNGGIQYIQPPPQQPQIQQGQQPQQPQIQQAQQLPPQFQFAQIPPQFPRRQPNIMNVDGVQDNPVLFDPINNQYMRPDGLDRVQVVDEVDMMRPDSGDNLYPPDFDPLSIPNTSRTRPTTAGTRPSTSGSNPPRPNRPPPPIPDEIPPPVPDEFQDALDPTQNIANLPQSDIVFAGQRPRPELQRRTKRLPAYIERVGDNIQIEGTDLYVSKRDGLNLTSKIYSRSGRGRTANRLLYSGMTYGDYLDTQRQQGNVPPELPPEPPMRVEQPIQEEGNIPIQQEDPYIAEITRLTGLTGIQYLPMSRPPSVPPRPPSTPKPFPSRPPTPSISPSPSITPEMRRESSTNVSADIVYRQADTPENLNFWVRQYQNITPEEFDRLTTDLRRRGIPFDVPRELRGRVKLTPDPIDINSGLPPEERPDTSESKNRGLLQRMTDTISKYTALRKTSKVVPDISPEISPAFQEGQEGQYEPFPPEEPPAFLDRQASQIRANLGDLLDDTTRNIVISTMDIPPIAPSIVPEIVPEITQEITSVPNEDIDTTILPEDDKMIAQANRMRQMTNRLFDETTQKMVSPPSTENEPNPDEVIKLNFEKKYREPQRRRPSSGKGNLEEAVYQSKMEEVKLDLEQFDREYGFNYQNYLEGQNIPKDNIEKMTDYLIKKYGISHKASDFYIKEFLDTFSESEKKQILKDYEDSIVSNVSFYMTKLSRSGISTRNLKTRLSGDMTDEQKRELFIRTLTDTNILTANFGLFSNEDFREFLFQKYCRENNISLDNPRSLLEIITPVRYPYGARRRIIYRKPTPPISPASMTPPTPSSTEDKPKLKFGEPNLPSVIEEQPPTPVPPSIPPPPPRRTTQQLTPIGRTRREQEEMDAIANRRPVLPPPPPPRRKVDAPKRPSVPKKK